MKYKKVQIFFKFLSKRIEIYVLFEIDFLLSGNREKWTPNKIWVCQLRIIVIWVRNSWRCKCATVCLSIDFSHPFPQGSTWISWAGISFSILYFFVFDPICKFKSSESWAKWAFSVGSWFFASASIVMNIGINPSSISTSCTYFSFWQESHTLRILFAFFCWYQT